MATMNIAGNTPVEDPAYRYKMPRIVAKVEGRGNGIKTVLMNVIEVGQSLNREAPEITKFFGCELGSQTTYSGDTDRAIVNGAHSELDLQNHLRKYIENFVLCKNCRLPETHYKFKNGIISQKCLACGNKDPVDMTHKLTTFILAQHKKNKDLAAKAEKEDKKDKKEKKKDKEKEGKKDGAAAAAGDGEEGGEKKEKKEKSSSKKDKSKRAEGDPESPRDGETGEKKDKKKKSKKNKSAGEEDGEDDGAAAAGGADAEEEEETDSKAADEGIDRLRLWLQENSDHTTQQLLDELRSIQTFASLRPADRVIIYLGGVFTDGAVTGREVAKHKAVLKSLAPSPIQQRHLIAAFEWLCGRRYPSLMKFFPVILKQLLDEELVEEDVFFDWAADISRNEFTAEQSMIDIDTLEHLKGSAKVFIKWLQEAEVEGEEEEGDDDDEDDEDGDEDEEDD